MRTRQRTIVNTPITRNALNATYSNVNCTGNVVAGSGPIGAINTYAYQKDERMEDTTGPGAHGVWHRSREIFVNTNYPADFSHAGGAQGQGYTVYGGQGIVNAAVYRSQLDLVSTFQLPSAITSGDHNPAGWTIGPIPSSTETVLIENCFEKARQLKADLLLNAVEGHQLWPAVRSLATAIPEMAYQWGRLRKVVATASGAFLAWKFGIAPVISDIESVQKYLPKMRDDIERAVKGDKQRFSSFATVSLKHVMADINNASNYIDYKGGILKNGVVRYVLVVKPKSSQYYTDFFKKTDAVLNRFATSPAQLAWELVPWSFVVDWFIDLRGALRALDGLLGDSPFEVIAFTRSFGYHVETNVSYRVKNSCTGAFITDETCGNVRFKHYERSPVSSSATWPTWKPRFGKNQAGISAALIAQQLSKVVRK